MVNKTQFYKTKVALAVVVSLGLAACGGGDDSTATSNSNASTDATQNTVENQENLTGSVAGIVVDSFGNPVEGAVVALGTSTATTDISGHYQLDGIAVTNVNGVNNEGNEADDDVTQTLFLTVTKDGHLVSHISVTPQAQVNNTGGQGQGDGVGDAQDGGNSDVTIQTFVDGFMAEAAPAILVAEAASASVVLRSCTSGLPVADAKVIVTVSDIDFLALNVAGDELNDHSYTNNGSLIAVATKEYAATSNAEGVVSFANLPIHSDFNVSVEGYSVTAGTLSTNGIEESGDLSIQCITEVVDEDDVAPYLAFVTGGLSTVGTGEYGTETSEFKVLNKGVDGSESSPLVYNFNEPLATGELEPASFVVQRSLTAEIGEWQYDAATSTVDEAAGTITVVLSAPLEEGEKVRLLVPQHQIFDTSENGVVDASTAAGSDWTFLDALDNKDAWLQVYACAYKEPSMTASGLTGVQVVDHVTDYDGGTDTEDYAVARYSAAYADGNENVVDIQQLNGRRLLSGSGNIITNTQTDERLEELADAVTGTTSVNVINDVATILVEKGTASSVNIEYFFGDDDFTPATALPSVVTFAGTAAEPLPTYVSFDVDGTYVNAEGVVTATQINKVVLTPVDGFGVAHADEAATITLSDQIPTIPVLQESYGLGNGSPLTSTVSESSVGDGGEHYLLTEETFGAPLIHITPRLLAGTESAWTVAASGVAASGLYSDLKADTSTTTINANAYGQPQWDVWTPAGATMGIAFSEYPMLTATAPVWAGTAELTGWATVEHSANIDGADIINDGTNADLVTVDINNVMTLSVDANDSSANAINFGGAITDRDANVTAASARVVFEDNIPAFVTSAELSGTDFVVTFNEAISTSSANVAALLAMTITTGGTAPAGPAATVSLEDPQDDGAATNLTASEVSFSTDAMTVTFDLSGVSFSELQAVFSDSLAPSTTANPTDDVATDDDDLDFADTTTGAVRGHAYLDFSGVMDAAEGNSWDDYTGTGNARLAMAVAPNYLATDTIGPFAIQFPESGIVFSQLATKGGVAQPTANLGSLMTATYVMNQPIDEATLDGGTLVLPAAETNGTYDLTGLLTFSVDANADGDLLDAVDSGAANADFVLVGTNILIEDDVVDRSIILSADKYTLTFTFQSEVVTEQIGSCTTIIDGLAPATVDSEFNKSIADAEFTLWASSCTTPYVDDVITVPEVTTDYDRL